MDRVRARHQLSEKYAYKRLEMEEVPLRMNSDERDFEIDETDFLLQHSDHDLRTNSAKRRSKRCPKCLSLFFCGVGLKNSFKNSYGAC